MGRRAREGFQGRRTSADARSFPARRGRRLMLPAPCDTKAAAKATAGELDGHRSIGRSSRHGLCRTYAHLRRIRPDHDGDDRPHRAGPVVHALLPRALSAERLLGSPRPARRGRRRPTERDPFMVTIVVTVEREGETRLAVSPETVKKFT